MSIVRIDDIQRVLALNPRGLTTAELAQQLGIARPAQLAGRLSKWADRCMIGREYRTQSRAAPPGPAPRWCIWSLKSCLTSTIEIKDG